METKQGETKMSCAGFFETLQRQADEESFKKQVLKEIDEKKETLQKRLQSLQVQGDFHRAKQVKAKIEKLEKVTERMKQLLEA